ncbi:hypothetical protein LAZ67_10000614 [Cordylochernes scorpioides]|uniref:Transposase n=1 Tax=Cordylochernes scorpioides TaxID=51811 RepID=A0ABY6L058_9ARAC|nr:hypothetical protein LAZ67_10000614 [Cordylochernes scorpioides]
MALSGTFHLRRNGQKIITPYICENFCNCQKSEKYITTENPMPQRDIAKLIGTSVSTINKIINKDLGLKATKKKHAVHKLFQSHIRQRHTISRYFYENFLAADRWKFIVTYDEAWVYLTNCDRKRAIYYQKRVEKSRPIWLKECAESYPKGFMVACGISYEGKLKIRKVERNAKINSEYYQNNILEPIFLNDIPSIYGKQSNKNRTPVKSPDLAPMDFCIFGCLKRALGKRHPRTIEGLWKVVKEEWDLLSMTMIRKCLISWKIRCRSVNKQKGFQIEHLKNFKYGVNF